MSVSVHMSRILSAMPLQLRPYQSRIVREVRQRNVVVKMPTGSGKTLVAAECVRLALLPPVNRHTAKCALFLVPTCDLVDQQARALREWCTQLRVVEFMGRAAVPTRESYDVLVSTPEAFRRLQLRDNANFGWTHFAICVFDEVHHVLKDHPYRKLAHGLQSVKAEDSPQVLGLSASLTYAVGESAVQRALMGLSADLGLEDMLCVNDDELRAGGYEPPHGEVELAHPQVLPEGVVPEEDRRPHLMHTTFFDRIRSGEATALSISVHAVVRTLEEWATKVAPDEFCSPLRKQSLSTWEAHAHQLTKHKKLRAHEVVFTDLENWYVALRLLVTTWEEQEELVLHWLRCQNAFDIKLPTSLVTASAAASALSTLQARLEDPAKVSKIACLKAQLLEKTGWARARGDEIRAIVFVEQRITAHVLAEWIKADAELSAAGLRAGYVAARDARITPRLKVTPGQAAECIDQFRTGQLNVLFATSMIQEGFDVPKANVVISFDALKDSVELAQRFGRARQAERRIVAMDERRDRPIARLEQVRREQDALIEVFQPDPALRDPEAEAEAQRSRERGASQLLDVKCNENNPLQTLNLYAKKTKAVTTEEVRKDQQGFLYEWSYQTPLRQLRAEGRASSKKAAKMACALKLLSALRAMTNV